jgi:hypothetical protein
MISLKGWSEETLTQSAALLRQATTLHFDFALARAQLALFLSLVARLGLVADGTAAETEARRKPSRLVWKTNGPCSAARTFIRQIAGSPRRWKDCPVTIMRFRSLCTIALNDHFRLDKRLVLVATLLLP